MELKETNVRIDLLKVISAFLVVLIHTTADSFSTFQSDWWLANTLDSIARMSVPLFFMTSGFFLLNNNDITLQFFTKRLRKLLLPFLAWSMIYIIYSNHLMNKSLSLSQLSSLLQKPAYFHLWFFYTLIPIYLVTPLIKKSITNMDKQTSLYLIVLWLTFSLLPDFIYNLSLLWSKGEPRLGMDSTHLMIAMLGYYIIGGIVKKHNTITIKLSFFLFLIATALTSILTYFYSMSFNKPTQAFYVYYSPLVSISAISFFTLVLNSSSIPKKAELTIRKLSSLSLGIYFIHPLVIDFIKIHLYSINVTYNTASMSFFIAMLCFGISALICYCVRKTPIINRLI